VFVSTDGSGPLQLTSDISKMMATLPATVHGLTGTRIIHVDVAIDVGIDVGIDAYASQVHVLYIDA